LKIIFLHCKRAVAVCGVIGDKKAVRVNEGSAAVLTQALIGLGNHLLLVSLQITTNLTGGCLVDSFYNPGLKPWLGAWD